MSQEMENGCKDGSKPVNCQYQSDLFYDMLDFNIPVYPCVTPAFLAS